MFKKLIYLFSLDTIDTSSELDLIGISLELIDGSLAS
jgi:hypothetical protein